MVERNSRPSVRRIGLIRAQYFERNTFLFLHGWNKINHASIRFQMKSQRFISFLQ